MASPWRIRAIWLPARSRQCRGGQAPATLASVVFCTGLVLMPALAVLDLAVGLACRHLDHAACIALFQPPLQ